MTTSRVGAARRRWTHRGDTPIADLIERAWDDLAEMLEAGTLSEATFNRLMRRADEMDPSPVGQYLVLGVLRRALADPTQVGVNHDALTTYPCRCGPGYGMVEADTGWRPCADCNPGGYALWRDHWSAGCKGCPECRPDARRRGMQGDHRAERSEAEAERRTARTMQGLR